MGREDWSSEENRDEDTDFGGCVCVRVCFVVEGVGMDALVQVEEALPVVRPEDNPRTGPLHC